MSINDNIAIIVPLMTIDHVEQYHQGNCWISVAVDEIENR